MEKLNAFLKVADLVITTVLKWITIALFVVLIAIITLNILLRYFPFTSFHWMDEIVELCFGALVFYGAAAAWMARGHFSVGDWISGLLKAERAKTAYRLLIELLCLSFLVIFFKYSTQIAMRTMEVTAVFQIPKRALYSCMPISALIMGIYTSARCVALAGKLIRS